jgi:uncharacterized membrane protein
MFGLRWLRKAVSRAAGVLRLNDEAAAHTKGVRTLQRKGKAGRKAIDKVAFVTTFKTVMLEGIEVVFIVIALGAGATLLAPAAAGAALALLLAMALALVHAWTSMRAKVGQPKRAPWPAHRPDPAHWPAWLANCSARSSTTAGWPPLSCCRLLQDGP